jgi:tRNA A-37 threonylcarbamoyl transferase component Bud32
MAATLEEVPGYRLLEAAGRGGFSVVYRAYQADLDRVVALKVLIVEDVDDKVMRRFRRECRITGRLTGHPNIVTVLATGLTAAGCPYIATDYLERGSLRDRLRKAGPMPVGEVLRTGVKIAGALAAAHHAGIVHGDVKPQNILVSRFGEPALADFGIARLLTHDMSADTGAFTAHHAAPEVVGGGAPTAASDLYSLGSTLYQLLSGRPPFYREGDDAIPVLLLRILGEEAPPIGRPDLPPGLDRVIRTAMAKEPARRFADAPAFAAALQAVQHELGEEVTELPASRPAPAAARSGPTPRLPPQAVGDDAEDSRGGRAEDSRTVLREPLPEPPAAGRPSGRGRRPVVLIMAVVALAGLGAGIALRSTAGPTPHPARSRPAGTASPGPVLLNAARPRDLTVTDDGTSVVLHWRVGAAHHFPIFLERAPRDPAGLRPLADGTTTATVTGLDPSQGYCFMVGAVVAFGNPSAVAWSAPACIRDAVPG